MKPTYLQALIFVSGLGGTLLAQNYVNSQLPWHDAVVDAHGKLLAWHNPEKNLLLYSKIISAAPARNGHHN